MSVVGGCFKAAPLLQKQKGAFAQPKAWLPCVSHQRHQNLADETLFSPSATLLNTLRLSVCETHVKLHALTVTTSETGQFNVKTSVQTPIHYNSYPMPKPGRRLNTVSAHRKDLGFLSLTTFYVIHQKSIVTEG